MLIFTQYYTPAKKAGGPITSISNLVSSLDLDCSIVSRGQDLNERKNLDGIQVDKWTESNRNYFVGLSFRSLMNYLKILRINSKDVYYVNGIFDWKMNLLPLLFGKRIIISPRGMLQKGALENGMIKKKFYLTFLRYLLILKKKDITWHATDDVEYQDIKYHFKTTSKIQKLGNIPNFFKLVKPKPPKSKNQIKLVYYSLISQKKQLDLILKSITKSKYPISLDIFGPIKDTKYWKDCLRIINESEKLKENVHYYGHITIQKIPDILINYDYFILPTLGENFGHAIFESLNCNLPVIISSKTPWRFLENEDFGFILDTEITDEFWSKLLSLSEDEYHRLTLNARKKSEEFYTQVMKEIIPEYKKMFSRR